MSNLADNPPLLILVGQVKLFEGRGNFCNKYMDHITDEVMIVLADAFQIIQIDFDTFLMLFERITFYNTSLLPCTFPPLNDDFF